MSSTIFGINGPVDRRKLADLCSSDFFDPDFYLATYNDVKTSGGDPKEHFQTFGAAELRRANATFDPVAYLFRNPNLLLENINPYCDLDDDKIAQEATREPDLQCAESEDLGRIEGYKLFDEKLYVSNFSSALGCVPILHYLIIGSQADLPASPKFHSSFYRQRHVDVAAAGWTPIVHFLRHGRDEDRSTLPPFCATPAELRTNVDIVRKSKLFDEVYYRKNAPLVGNADPIEHYLQIGHLFYLSPSKDFSAPDYLAKNPHARHSAVPAFVNFLSKQASATATEVPVYKGSDQQWVPQPGDPRKPDCNVNIERMRSVAFFRGFDFGWAGEVLTGHAEAARDLLSERQPAIVAKSAKPDVSIIIPVYGQLPCALGCLESLSTHQSKYSIEIVIVDDCSPVELNTEILGSIPWIRYERRPKNGGFIASCNYGASVARGDYLIFLNSDVRVCVDWLDELLDTFTAQKNVGLVGSKLYNNDGSLQEAGGIYWRDGSAWNYGRNQSSSSPLYCFARQADYCSGASIAIPAKVFAEIGQFDTFYAPAYCEDSDIAFALRAAGYSTWFQALSRVIHFEGMSHGRDETKGIKAYQVRNMRLFAERWAHDLEKHGHNGQMPNIEVLRATGLRILVLDAVTPTPDQDSGSVITSHMINAFIELGHHVSFVPCHNYQYAGAYTDDLLRRGVRCFYAPFTHNIQQVIEMGGPFDYVLAYRVGVLAPVLDQIRAMMPTARVVFHNVDLHYLREMREAELRKDRNGQIKAAITQTDELGVMLQSDAVIVHTKVELDIIAAQIPTKNFIEFPYIADLKTSNETFDSRSDIVFLGGFAHTPNVDAVTYFSTEIWPKLVEKLPGTARFVIAGAKPPPSIQRLASDRIAVLGFVPDLEPVFAHSRIAIAPLRYGAGIKGKIVQYLAHGVPTVCSSVAAEGMGLTSEREVFIADDRDQFVTAIETLYTKRDIWERFQAEGYRFVDQRYSWTKCLETCVRILDIADATWLQRETRRRELRLTSLIEDAEGPAVL